MNFRKFIMLITLLGSSLTVRLVFAQNTPPQAIKNVILVHGAFSNGASWEKVIPLLQLKGLRVISVQLPLTSLADDVSTTKRALASLDGPVLLVGHSYGGVVITEAGNDPKVAGLVYVSAFAPNDGEAIGDLGKGLPKSPGANELRPQAKGFLMLSAKGITDDFAQDLSEEEKQILIATQAPTASSIFGAKITIAAWHGRPCWYVVSSEDRMISPELEKKMAKQLNAVTKVLPSSHVVMLSHPEEVATVIEEAASEKAK